LIRNLHFSDFLKLGQMHQAEVGLNLPQALVVPASPLTALIQQLPVNNLGSSVYIYQERKKPLAFLQARSLPRREEWEILALGTFGDNFLATFDKDEDEVAEESEEAETIELVTLDGAEVQVEQINKTELPETPLTLEIAWTQLLEHLVVDAGEKGAQRIYARLSTDSPQLPIFNQTGFHAFTREMLFVYDHDKAIERPVNLQLKNQRGRDLWQIHRLYETVTPSPVQHAEQLNSDSWEISKGYFPRFTKEVAWVMSEDQADRATAYVRILSHRNKHLIKIMNLDNQREILPDLLRFALSQLKTGADCQVYCSIREYQAEQEVALEETGFKYFGRQSVLVKHTATMVRVGEKSLAYARDRRLELPQTTVSTPSAANPSQVLSAQTKNG